MKLFFIKRLLGVSSRKAAKPRHTSSPSRELNKEFLDYAVQGFRRQQQRVAGQAAE